MLNQESIKEYQKILSAECGVNLSVSEAQSSAEAVLRLYQAVFKTNKYETGDEADSSE